MKKALQNLTKSLDQTKAQMQEQSVILKQQTQEIQGLKNETDEKNWGKKFFKKLTLGLIITSIVIGILYFTKITTDMGSILGVVGIAATALGTIFGVWYSIHKSRIENV